MNNTDKVYLIKWVGPFSYDELYNWEKKWLENNNENFNLILEDFYNHFISKQF